MKFDLKLTDEAKEILFDLKNDPSKAKIYKAVRKTLRFMEKNLKHPSLNTHKFVGYKWPNDVEVFEAYAQQKTPRAYRVIWCYGPNRVQLTIITIIPHPD